MLSNYSLSRFLDWLQKELPYYNNAADTGSINLDTLVAASQPWVQAVGERIDSVDENLTRQEARQHIKHTAFIASSIERHARKRGDAPGSGIGLLPSMQDILVKLSQVGQVPPRDTHDTLWGENNEPFLSFTGDPQEINFLKGAKEIDKLNLGSCSALLSICQGVIPITSAEATEGLEHLAENESRKLTIYQGFRETTESTGITPKYFATTFRTYLLEYPIQGETWGGPNATNFYSQPALDYLFGVTLPWYDPIVEGRLRYMRAEDREKLNAYRQLPSVTELLVKALGLTLKEVLNMSNHALVAHIAQASPEVHKTLIVYSSAFKAMIKPSASHSGLIQTHLVKVAQQLTPEEKASLPVSPERGVGGHTHSQTKAIANMRCKHPVASKMAKAVLNPFQLES